MVAQSARNLPDDTASLRLPTSWAGLDIDVGVPIEVLEAEWRALEAHRTASVFQSWSLALAWTTHAAAARQERPLIVTGRERGRLRMILPLGLVRQGGVDVVQWLAQSHANYGMGLFDPALLERIEAGDTDQLIIAIAKQVGAGVVHLDRQPARWAGHANPFAASPCARRSANDTFVVALAADFAGQYARLFPKRALQPLKRRKRRLEEMGALSFTCPRETEAKQKAFRWFVARKREQLAETSGSNPFDEPGILPFYEALLAEDDLFEIDQVLVGTQRAALGMTLYGGGVAYGVNTAHVAQFSRGSPGTLLQHHIIAKVHARGARAYDLGPGFLPYKMEWAPDVVPLLATSHAVGLRGVPMQVRLVIETLAKAQIKRSPRLSALRRWLGRMLSSMRGGAPAEQA